LSRRNSVTDLRYGLDSEGAAPDPRCNLTNARDSAIDRILADDSAAPATVDQLIARDDRAS
jgi:hypothetical protein